MNTILDRLLNRADLDHFTAGDLLRGLADPKVPDALKGALLAALRAKGETPAEIRGMALATRDMAVPLDTSGVAPLVDTCGTGGDGSGSLNVSTATALLVATLGYRVVKHGNRSVSSRSGSADVLEALGVRIPETSAEAARLLADTQFTFLFAPVFHPAMKAVAPVRRAMRTRTAFNVLGPLTNPARPPYQLVGAYSPAAAELMAGALSGMPIRRAFVVHGDPGWDEATPCGPFLLFDVRPGQVERRTVDPADYGLARCRPDDLRGGDAMSNARELAAVLGGQPGPYRDAVVLNAALVLQLTGRIEDPAQAAAHAAAALDGARATRLLDRLSGRREAA